MSRTSDRSRNRQARRAHRRARSRFLDADRRSRTRQREVRANRSLAHPDGQHPAGKRPRRRSADWSRTSSARRLDDVVFGAWNRFGRHLCRRPAAVCVESVVTSQKASPRRFWTFARCRPPSTVLTSSGSTVTARWPRSTSAPDPQRDPARTLHTFREEKQVDRVVMLWAASTEIFIEPGPVHETIEAFKLRYDAKTTPNIAPSMTVRLRGAARGACPSPTARPT